MTSGLKTSTKLWALLTISVCVISAGIIFVYNRPLPNNDNVVLTVGGINVSKSDFDSYLASQNCYTQINSSQAAVLLIGDLLEESVLRQAFGLSPDIKTLEDEAEVIKQESKAPEILACVLKAFGENHNSYLNFFVKKVLINPRLHDEFSKSPDIQQNQKLRAEEILAQAIKSKSLEGFPEYKKTYIKINTEVQEELGALGVKQSPNILTSEILPKMKPGDVWEEVIEDSLSYKVLKLLGKDDGGYNVEIATIKKADFEEWFNSFVLKNIKVIINDFNLYQEIKNTYPDIWWLKLTGKN